MTEKKFLTTQDLPLVEKVDKPKKTMGPIMGRSPAAKPLLQIYGLSVPSMEERTSEILERAKAARARKASEAKKGVKRVV